MPGLLCLLSALVLKQHAVQQQAQKRRLQTGRHCAVLPPACLGRARSAVQMGLEPAAEASPSATGATQEDCIFVSCFSTIHQFLITF